MSVDGDALVDCAERHSVVIEILPSIGDFVVASLPLLRVAPKWTLETPDFKKLLACFTIDRQRTVHQDAPFGLQQIVDIGMKALSPGVNDPTTAIACLDHLSALMAAMANRHIPSPCRAATGTVRVVARGPDFASMLSLAFDAMSEHAADHVEVHERVASGIGRIAAGTAAPDPRAALARQLQITAANATRAGIPAHRLSRFDSVLKRERARMDHGTIAAADAHK